MSEPASRLPARPSLEQLRKQAKDLLKACRAGESAAAERFRSIIGSVPPAPSLADAQFVLAREYGFESWAALARHVETIGPAGLGQFEHLADEVAAAYTTADVERLREVNWAYGTSFVWYREAGRMHEQLPAWHASESKPKELALQDARHLVARKAGFEDWPALVTSMTSSSPVPAGGASPDVTAFYRINSADNSIDVRGPLPDVHWETVATVIAERGLTGLRSGGVTDAALERLSRAGSLQRLHIAGGLLTDAGLRHLARFPHVQELEIGGPNSPLTDRGLGVLGQLRVLRRFSTTWSPKITDAGAAHLSSCDQLESVNLMGTPTGDGALAALAGKHQLRKISTGRLVTDAGMPWLQQVPRFKTWSGGDIEYELASFDAEPTSLLLDGPFTDDGLAGLSGLDGLVGVNLFWHTPGFTSHGLASLAELRMLEMLGCDGKRCDDQAMQSIASLPRLRMLMAQGTIATDDGFVALSRSPTLEYIWGRETPNLTGRGFTALASMPALRGIALSCHNVDDDALALLPAFPSLRALMPIGLEDDGIRHVGRCGNLENLWFMYCRDTTDAATAHIAGLSKLRTYYAGQTRITDRSLEILAGMTSLEKIEIWNCDGVTNAGVARLARLPRLTELAVDNCRNVRALSAAGFGPQVRVSYTP